jgi:hypothetical protein
MKGKNYFEVVWRIMPSKKDDRAQRQVRRIESLSDSQDQTARELSAGKYPETGFRAD